MIDLDVLGDRLHSAMPQLTIERVQLEHLGTKERREALLIESPERKVDHVYRMTVTVIDDEVNFFVHVHGASKDLTTEGAHCYSKKCADEDEVFAIVHSCWAEGAPS